MNTPRPFFLFYHFVYIKHEIERLKSFFILDMDHRVNLCRVPQLCYLALGSTWIMFFDNLAFE